MSNGESAHRLSSGGRPSGHRAPVGGRPYAEGALRRRLAGAALAPEGPRLDPSGPDRDAFSAGRDGGCEPEADGSGRQAGGSGRAAGCHVLSWARSGAMALTGWPDEPAWPAADVIGALDATGDVLSELSARLGRRVVVDPGWLLCARARFRPASRRPARQGTLSAGGRCRLLRAVDDWTVLNLSRADDLSAVPALTGGRVDRMEARDDRDDRGLWGRLAAEVSRRRSAEWVAAARELGMPAAVLGEEARAGTPPWRIDRLGPGRVGAVGPRPTVVDFSALWAGPLCAQLLAGAGARVVVVESADRPDSARTGDAGLHAALRRGHERVTVDFSTREGRRRIHQLVTSADVVLEASRPRALAELGLDAGVFLADRPGRTWVSVTGYGRTGRRSQQVAFGDDAAVAGGLVARDRRGTPTFCADAVADPVTGLLAAVAALTSVVSGGGHLVDCSMAGASAFVGGAPSCPGTHRVERTDGRWTAFHDDLGVPVAAPWGPCRPLASADAARYRP